MTRGQSELHWIDKWVKSKEENGWNRAKVALVPCKHALDLPSRQLGLDSNQGEYWPGNGEFCQFSRPLVEASGTFTTDLFHKRPVGVARPTPKEAGEAASLDHWFVVSVQRWGPKGSICLMLSSQHDVLTDQIRKPTSKAAAIMAWIESSCKSLATSFQIEVQRWCASHWNDNSTLQH